MTSKNGIGGVIYMVITFSVWVVTFLGSWIYCISAYGSLFGVGLGWLPSIFVASVAALLWPLILIGAALLYVVANFSWHGLVVIFPFIKRASFQ
jgi:hypothetical protein